MDMFAGFYFGGLVISEKGNFCRRHVGYFSDFYLIMMIQVITIISFFVVLINKGQV